MEQSNSQVISFLRKKETKLWGFLALMFILILSFVSIQRHTVHIPETIGREVAHAIVHRNGKNYILDNLAQTVRLSIKNFKLNELKVDNILTIAATMLLESDTVFNAYEANINSLLNEVVTYAKSQGLTDSQIKTMFAFYAAEAKKTSKLFAFAIKNNKELELRFKEKNRTKKICKKTDIKYWNMRQDFNDKWKNDTESLQKANEYVFKAYLADKSAIKKTGTALNRACTLAESVAKSLVDFVVDNVGKSIPTHDFIFWLGERHNRQGSGIKIWTVYKKMANDVIERLTAMKSSMNTGK